MLTDEDWYAAYYDALDQGFTERQAFDIANAARYNDGIQWEEEEWTLPPDSFS